jgi:tetratricopeptide (TPR) repeat protein
MGYRFILPQEIYDQHLEVINHVRFTKREMDVIACLLNNQVVNYYLRISEKTVASHLSSIKNKLNVKSNPRSAIIKFINSSNKLLFVKQYYLGLKLQEEFEDVLKGITKLNDEETLPYLIVHEEEKIPRHSFLELFINHLKLAGIKILKNTKGIQKPLSLSNLLKKFQQEDYVIYAIPKSCITPSVKNEKQSITFESKHRILFFLPEVKSQNNIPKEYASAGLIDFECYENYYSMFFEILKRLLPHLNLEEIISSFKERLEARKELFLSHQTPSFSEENILEKNDAEFHFKIRSFLKSKRWQLLSCALIICLVGAGSLFFGKNKYHPLPHDIMQKKLPIRSDLLLPTESSLLNREDLLTKIYDKFKKQPSIQAIALIGPGGAGKTTIARQYAKQQKVNVAWEINGETPESLQSSFERLADVLSNAEEDKKRLRGILEIKNLIEREDKVIQFVKEHLQSHSNWFLIYDNVEKFSDIQKFFPQDLETWGNGNVIVTTRNSNIQNNKHISDVVQIGELSDRQKFNLFIQIMSTKKNPQPITYQNEETIKFLKEIPPYPLDVSIAAYYLRATHIPYAIYLKNMTQYNKDFKNLQTNLLKESGDYVKTRYGIITLSLDHLIKAHEDLAELLLFISLLDSQNIPRDLLDKYKNNTVVDNFIYHLKEHSLIISNFSDSEFSPKGFSFSIHRSTQGISLAFLIKKCELAKNNQQLKLMVNVLTNHAIELIKTDDYSKMEDLAKHFEKFLSHSNLLTQTMKGSIESILGSIYYRLGNYENARLSLEKGYNILNKNESEAHSLIAHTLIYLGTLYKKTGDYKKAKYLLEESLIIYNNHLPTNYEMIAWASFNLGDAYRNLGKHTKAKDLLEKSLSIYRTHAPKNYSGMVWSLTYLGNFYRDQGHYEKARISLEESLFLSKNHVSPNPLSFARILGYLGRVYKELGSYDKAKNMAQQSLSISQEHLPEENLDIAWALRGLGMVYNALEQYENAKKVLEKSLSIYKSKNHIDVSSVFWCLGNTYKGLGHYEEARKLLQKSLVGYENQYGKDHLNTAFILRDLGEVYLREDHLEASETSLQKALEIFQQYKHPDNYTVLEILTELYLEKSKRAENKGNLQQSHIFKVQALTYLNQALKIVRTYFPSDSPHIKRIQNRLKNLEKGYK